MSDTGVVETTDVVSTEYTIHTRGSFAWSLSWLKSGSVKMRRKAWATWWYVTARSYHEHMSLAQHVGSKREDGAHLLMEWGPLNADLLAEDWEVYEDAC